MQDTLIPHPVSHTVICKDMPVRLITPKGEVGYFRVTRMGRRELRIRGVSRKTYDRVMKEIQGCKPNS